MMLKLGLKTVNPYLTTANLYLTTANLYLTTANLNLVMLKLYRHSVLHLYIHKGFTGNLDE